MFCAFLYRFSLYFKPSRNLFILVFGFMIEHILESIFNRKMANKLLSYYFTFFTKAFLKVKFKHSCNSRRALSLQLFSLQLNFIRKYAAFQ
jgi:hypothetical protein